MSAIVEFVQSAFQYNLQVLPDTVMAAAILFAVLFQSPPMATLATALVSLTFLHPRFAALLQQVIPGLYNDPPSNGQRCSGRFPGITYEALLGIANRGNVGGTEAWPSYYSTFVGFLAGWVGTLPALYAAEIAAQPQRAATTMGGIAVLAVLCLTVMMYRIQTGCESFASTSVGLLSGFVMGLVIVLFVAWLSDRRLTNVLGLPLLRDKAEDGKPIYVCERGVPPPRTP
jgi:hypothetical protein